MEKLTDRQDEILEFIKKYKAKHGFPPTIREICKELNLKSPATVHTHLNNLVNKGYIKKDSSKNRSIELLVKNNYAIENQNVIEVPLLGKVTAGNPIEAIEFPNEYFNVPTSLIPKNKEVFALKVRGDSMINVGIYDNDIVIVQRQKTAKNGEKIVAMTDKKEVTLKTFYKEKNSIRLQPENDTMEPIIVSNVTILGKVIGLYRKI